MIAKVDKIAYRIKKKNGTWSWNFLKTSASVFRKATIKDKTKL